MTLDQSLKSLDSRVLERFSWWVCSLHRSRYALEQVSAQGDDQGLRRLLEYYMGKNTMERQNFIIDNLFIEEDLPEEEN